MPVSPAAINEETFGMTLHSRLVRLIPSAVLCLSSVLLIASTASAAQTASPYLTATRYNLKRQIVGVIKPSPDGTAKYLARRNVYDDSHGWLLRIEEGWLSAWQDETVAPSSWTGFTLTRKTVLTYDDLGRRKTESVVTAGGTTVSLTHYAYDDLNQVTCRTVRMNSAIYGSLPTSACTLGTEGAEGPDRITHFDYNGYGQVTFEKRAYGTTIEQDYASYGYDTLNRLSDETDANGNRTHLTYDAQSRVEYMYFPSKTAPGEYSTTDYEKYGYDANGNRISLRKRDGKVVSYGYDSLNRLTLENYPTGTIKDVYIGYDLRNLQLYARFDSAADTATGLTNTYDGLGRLSTAKTNQSGGARSLSYLYDTEGHRTRVTHPDGSYFVYSYDGLNRLKTISENGTTTVATVTYDDHGRRQTLSRGANVSTTGYTYDGVSRLQTLTQNLSGTAYDETRTLGYNPANQIVSRTLTNNTYVFSQVPTVGTDYSVNGLNEYIAVGTASPAHDANGNMTSDGSTTFVYDVVNRMTKATGTKTITLEYDPKGRLFQTTSTGTEGTKQYLYDGDELVAEYSSAGTLLRRYVHGAEADDPLIWYEGSSVAASGRRYYHVDHQGSVVAATDSTGTAIKTNTYDPYGVPASTNTTRFQYTGQIMVPDLGLYYYKARIYNPRLGRFMQTDPVGYKDDLDLYTYVGSDPLNQTDPSGQIIETLWDIYSLAQGVTSFGGNLVVGNYGAAAVDGIGIIADAAAVMTPGVPGGAGVAIKAGRAADRALDARRVEKTASGKRVEDFTKSQKEAAKAENAAANGGQMKCTDCAAPVESIKSEKGVATPPNQAQIHHDPAIKDGGTRESKPVVLCPECHRQRHRNE